MSTVIDRQIDALRESVVEQEAGATFDVGDMVAIGLMLYDALQGQCRRADQEIAAGKRSYDLAAARVVWNDFVVLHDLLRAISRFTARAQGEGRTVEGMDRLERAIIECGLIASVSPDRADAAEGRNAPRKTMAEVRDEVRRRLGA